MAEAVTPGELAYREDCARWPHYDNAGRHPRCSWSDLSPLAQSTWHSNPTPRRGFSWLADKAAS